MKMYGGVEVQLHHSYLSTGWRRSQLHALTALHPWGKSPWYPLDRYN
jgi:hypothetical protein